MWRVIIQEGKDRVRSEHHDTRLSGLLAGPGRPSTTLSLSGHNRGKHQVEDVNSRWHNPIGLEDVWATKWWPHRQFTFLASVAEPNNVNARARGRGAPADPRLDFRRQLAKGIPENIIGHHSRVVPDSPARNLRPRCHMATRHELMTHPKFTCGCDTSSQCWSPGIERQSVLLT